MSIELEDVRYDSKNKIIVLKGKIEPTVGEIKQAFNQVLEMCEIEKCNKVLVDGTNTKKLPSISEIYSLSLYMLTHIKKLLKIRIAYAISDEVSDRFRFFDTVITNRGGPIHKFNNLDDAKEWLVNK